eukprot:gene17351-biopygen830
MLGRGAAPAPLYRDAVLIATVARARPRRGAGSAAARLPPLSSGEDSAVAMGGGFSTAAPQWHRSTAAPQHHDDGTRCDFSSDRAPPRAPFLLRAARRRRRRRAAHPARRRAPRRTTIN